MLNTLVRNISALALLIFCATVSANEQNYVPYEVVTSKHKKENTVEVIFQLDCPYCRKMHHSMKAWEKGAKAYGVNVVYVPAVSAEKFLPMALAIESIKMNAPEKLDVFLENAYSLIQDQRRSVASFSTYYDAAEMSGLDRKKLEYSIVNGGDELAKRVKRVVNDVDDYNVKNVPSLVVNGKYMTHVGFTDGNYELFFGLINGLVSQGMNNNET